jgi:small-conductance mechanosensitive channel
MRYAPASAHSCYHSGVTPAIMSLSFNTDQAIKDLLSHGARVLVVIIVAVLVVRLINGLVTPVLRIAVREQMIGEPRIEVEKRIETLSLVISRTTVTVVSVAAVLTALPEIGLNVAPLIAGVGIVGLAVGFGAQNLVRDLINGLFILIENQYGKGDIVEIAGKTGLVEDLNLRRTVLRDTDGVVHFVPHGEVKTASNKTKGFSRVNLNLALAYGADMEEAFKVIDQVGRELAADPQWQEKVREAPVALRVEKLNDASIEVNIAGVTEPGDQWAVTGELRRRLVAALSTAGIRLALAQPAVRDAAGANDGPTPASS